MGNPALCSTIVEQNLVEIWAVVAGISLPNLNYSVSSLPLRIVLPVGQEAGCIQMGKSGRKAKPIGPVCRQIPK